MLTTKKKIVSLVVHAAPEAFRVSRAVAALRCASSHARSIGADSRILCLLGLAIERADAAHALIEDRAQGAALALHQAAALAHVVSRSLSIANDETDVGLLLDIVAAELVEVLVTVDAGATISKGAVAR